MTSMSKDYGPTEYTPESSPYREIIMQQEKNAMERVCNLPLVASTFDLVCSYYCSAKKTYPSVTPYLEFAEKISSSTASVALSTTKPVVDKLAPTVNSYANRGLDKLEDALPLICNEPNQIYGSAKATVTSAVNRRIDSVLSTTESYVDYYLPSSEDEHDEIETDDDSDDDESDTSSTDTTEFQEEFTPKERLQVISNKVRRRTYRRAMSKLRGVHKRSVETLNQLQFTVDLIRYAKDNMESTRDNITTKVSAANDSIKQGVAASRESVMTAWEDIKVHSSDVVAEVHLLERAQSLVTALHESCSTLLSVASNIPNGEYWDKNIAWAKDAADTLLHDWTGKSSLSELSSTLIDAVQKRVEHARQFLDAWVLIITKKGQELWLRSGMEIFENVQVDFDLELQNVEKEKDE